MDDETDFFFENPYSWNKEANIVYLESPAGVGYSYCEDMNECDFDDVSGSIDNLEALRTWYDKFPSYKSHELYITGESYAGVYVPYLAYQIDQFNNNETTKVEEKINLKGIMVGNGVTDW